MSATEANKNAKPSAAARAEAAAWVARLHGPNRTREAEAGFRRWLAEDAERAAAFELLTDTWEKSARLRRRPLERVASWEQIGFRISFSRAAFASLAVAVVAVLATLLYLHSDALSTGIGEQRTLTLADGTRVYLNTDTRAIVRYDQHLRRVELQRGEALFEVAKRSDRPFVVTAGERQIKALGTAFVVRRDERQVAVTLVEGRIAVSAVNAATQTADAQTAASARPGGAAGAPVRTSKTLHPGAGETVSPETFTLSPGQRLTFDSAATATLDTPELDKLTAWQRGQVALDNMPLADAVAEMNRYSVAQLLIDARAADHIRVSGIFRAGDSANFAQAVARTYGLEVRDQRGDLVLGDKP